MIIMSFAILRKIIFSKFFSHIQTTKFKMQFKNEKTVKNDLVQNPIAWETK